MIVRRYVVGLDVAPPPAFTALAVVERADDDRAPDADPSFAVRHLQRFPPGAAYKVIAAAVGNLLAAEGLEDAPVVLDLTAVGEGVRDLFGDLAPRPRLVPVVVTAGHHAEYGDHDTWLVPKKELVTGLQLLLQGRRLAIPTAMPEADLLARELGNFRARVSLAGDPLQVDWREGRDDDLVLAVALACWEAGRMDSPFVDWSTAVSVIGGRSPNFPWALFPHRGGRPPLWR